MPHVKAKFLDTGGRHGEFSVDDMVVFPGGGALAHVGQFWEAVVAQSLLLDQAHAVSVRNWAEASGDQRDPEFAIEASYRAEVLALSDQYLLRANIYALLLAFFEFAMREVYRLKFEREPEPPEQEEQKRGSRCALIETVRREICRVAGGQYPKPQKRQRKPDLHDDIIKPLKKAGTVPSDLPSGLARGQNTKRDDVRNAFSHGQWTGLKDATSNIDLYDVFHSICGYLSCVAERLREQGLNP